MPTSPTLFDPDPGDRFEGLTARQGLLTARDVNAETFEAGCAFGFIPAVAQLKRLNIIEPCLEYRP